MQANLHLILLAPQNFSKIDGLVGAGQDLLIFKGSSLSTRKNSVHVTCDSGCKETQALVSPPSRVHSYTFVAVTEGGRQLLKSAVGGT